MPKPRNRFALLVVLAILGCASSIPAPASAAEFKAGNYPAELTGSQLIAERAEFFFNGGWVLCETATLTGTLGAASAELTLHPVFGTCTAFGFKEKVTFTTTECDYKLHAGANKAPGVYEGTMDVVCAAGKSIKLSAGTCELEIKNVNGLKNLELANDKAGIADLTLKLIVANLPYTVTKDGMGCPLSGVGNFNAGVALGRYTITAMSGGGETALEVS